MEQTKTQQERIAFINARQKLLQYFLFNNFDNDVEKFSKYNVFSNDKERMQHFINNFEEFYHFHEKIQCDIAYGKGMCLTKADNVPHEEVNSLKESIKVIKKYFDLE